jgi:NO-binding membrane sensor protein with MHYT domain
MAGSVVFQIDWTTVAMVIGLLASFIALGFCARRQRQ